MWKTVYTPKTGAAQQNKKQIRKYGIRKYVGWKSRRRLPPIPKRSIPPGACQKNTKHLGQRIRKSVVICYWMKTPEGAALFRPTYLGICGGLMFGVDCVLPAHESPKNIKNVGWKSRRRLPPIPKRSIPSGICQNKRCLHTKKRIILRSTYS